MSLLRNQPRGYRVSIAEIMVLFVIVAVACRWPLTISLAVPAIIVYLSGKFTRPTDTDWTSYFYRMALPTVWLITAWTSWRHPGDEYGMFVVSALPAAWIAPLISHARLEQILPFVLAAGAVTILLVAWGLDRMRVRILLWAPLYVCGTIALVLWALSGYPSYQRAMSKNSSLTAYITSGANLSLYLSTLASFLLTALARVVKLLLNRNGFTGRDETPENARSTSL